MKSSREQFEEWFDIKSSEFRINGLGSVHMERLRDKYWESWQASREAMAKEEVTTAPFIKVSE